MVGPQERDGNLPRPPVALILAALAVAVAVPLLPPLTRPLSIFGAPGDFVWVALVAPAALLLMLVLHLRRRDRTAGPSGRSA